MFKTAVCFHRFFCGGATIGINCNFDKIIFIDKNKQVIELLNFLVKQDFEKLLSKPEKEINNYNLSYSSKFSFQFYSKQIVGGNKNNRLKELMVNHENLNVKLQDIRAFLDVFINNPVLTKFDRGVFENKIEKVIVGGVDNDGKEKPNLLLSLLRKKSLK